MRRLSPAPRVPLPARGLTLVELMVGITVTAVLLGMAAPWFGDLVANARLREGAQTLVSEALQAQGEAVRRNAVVAVVLQGSTVRLVDRSDPGAPVTLRERTLAGGVAVAADATVAFGSDGRPSGMLPAAVDLRLATHACSADIRCTGLRVDAGGAIRLCADTRGAC